MTRRRCFLGLLVASLGAVAGTGSSAGSAPFHPSCAAVTTTLAHPDQGAQGPKLYNLAFRVRCNFHVLRLSLKSSRSLVRILPSPVLEHPDQGDTLSCKRPAPKGARCLGDVGENVRIVGELKVRGRPCASRCLACASAPLAARTATSREPPARTSATRRASGSRTRAAAADAGG